MGKIRFGFTTVVGATVGAAAYLALKISRETGKGFVEALSEVPAEAERYWEEVRARGVEAFAAGREAASQKQAEVEERLRGRD